MNAEKPPLPRTFIIIAFGPLVGAVVMAVLMLAMAVAENPGDTGEFLLYGMLLYLSFGYVAGFLPAIAAALLWRFVPRDWTRARRIVAAVLIGGLTSAILVWPFMSLFLNLLPPNLIFGVLASLCGAIALLATTLPGSPR